jgi:succinyl-CoA synthetase beta subunit
LRWGEEVKLKIHEYQGKEILRRYGVAVPRGEMITKAEEARGVAERLGGGTVVVKAQIHAGGRGKGGGVKLAKSPGEAAKIAGEMLGMTLVTHQTGPEGKVVQRVLIEQGIDIAKEYYLGIVLDRAKERAVIMASTEGGVEIEKVAAETPELILKAHIDPIVGLQPFQARSLAFGLGMEGEAFKNTFKFITALYKAFQASDCSLAEINPLVRTTKGEILALDAKMNFDDSALFRHPDYEGLRDYNEEEPLETEAGKYDLNYIKLDGSIGCMVNGAGLAMATMDLIKHSGGMPANFLDVGGGASVERVAAAFRILMSDKNVKAVLINIFGGIVRCDRVAGGVIEAMETVKVDVPVVVRLQGTNADQAAEMLSKSDLDFIVAKGLAEAAQKAVAAMKGGAA